MQFVVVVALQGDDRVIDERLPHVDVIVLVFSRRIGLDERGGKFGLHT